MSAITTHILDLSLGRPAEGVAIVLSVRDGAGGGWRELGQGRTDADGRLRTLLPTGQALAPGTYLLRFDTGEYFANGQTKCFYPEVTIVFRVDEPGGHYHVPLLLSPFGYSTYRGS